MSGGCADEGFTFESLDLVEMLRLANALHRAVGGPAARKQALLAGLLQLTGAGAGLCVVAHADGPSGPPLVVSLVRTGRIARKKGRGRRARHEPNTDPVLHCLFTRLFPDWRPRPGNEKETAASREAIKAPMLCSSLALDRRPTWAAVALTRRDPECHPFTPRDQRLVDLFLDEMRWIYDLDLVLTSPEASSLPRRPQETLQHLLAGYSEKEIAGQLDLSLNTVHHYVKRLYKHFRVTSRSELLARWVKE